MKTQFMLPAALIVGLAGASAQAADVQLKVRKSTPIETFEGKSGNVINGPMPFYSNITTFSGSAVIFGGTGAIYAQPGGGTGLLTSMVCDDLILQPDDPGGSYVLNDIQFTIANRNTITVGMAPTVLFYNQDGAASPPTAPLNGPGTPIDGIVFNLVGQLPAMSVSLLSADVSSLGITFPLDANGEAAIWACQMFDDDNGTALDQNNAHVTVAEYDNLGAGLCDPPTVGSSFDDLFGSYAPVTGLYSNPAGDQFNFAGEDPPGPVASLCLELSQ